MSALKSRRHFGFPDRHSPELLPAVMGLALLLAAGLQLVLPWSPSLPGEAGNAPRRAPAPADPVAQHFPAILHAPIFAPDRAPVNDIETASSGLNGYTVLGIAVAGDVAAALVSGPDGKILRVLRGATLGGWQLTRVDRTQLTFERNGDQRLLVLDKKPPQISQQSAPSNDNSSQDDSGDNDGGGDQ